MSAHFLCAPEHHYSLGTGPDVAPEHTASTPSDQLSSLELGVATIRVGLAYFNEADKFKVNINSLCPSWAQVEQGNNANAIVNRWAIIDE